MSDTNAYRKNIQDNNSPQQVDSWSYNNSGSSGVIPARDIYKRIAEVGQTDADRGAKLAVDFYKIQNTQGSPYYNAYSKATNQAIGNLANMGINASGMTTDWFKMNTDWQKNLVYSGTSNSPVTPPKKTATAAQKAAYQMWQVAKAAQDTEKRDSEWAAMQQEIYYWTKRQDLNLSDDEIIDKIEKEKKTKYPTLYAMDNSTGVGKTLLEFNTGTDYSKDNMYGVIWAARNGQSSGNVFRDNLMSAAGKGNTWQDNQEISAKMNRDKNNADYSPFSVGATADDTCLYWGVTGIDDDMLKKIESQVDWNNQTDVDMYNQASDQLATTKQAEKEKADLEETIRTWVNRRYSEETIQKKLEKLMKKSDFATLRKMDENIERREERNKMVQTTYAVNYRRQDIDSMIHDLVTERDNRPSAAKTMKDIVSGMSGMVTNPAGTIEQGVQGFFGAFNQIGDAIMGQKEYTAGPEQPEQPEQANAVPKTETTAPSYPVITDSDIEQAAEKDRKIAEAAATVENNTTPEEKVVLQNAGSSMWNTVRDFFSGAKADPAMSQTIAAQSADTAKHSFFDTALANVDTIANYENLEFNLSNWEEQLAQYEAKWGDVSDYEKEFHKEFSKIVENNVEVFLTYDDEKKRYVVSNIVSPERGITSMDEDILPHSYDTNSEAYRLMNVAEQTALQATEDANKVLAAQDRVKAGGKQAEQEIKNYINLGGQINQAKERLKTDEASYKKAKSAFENSYTSLGSVAAALDWLGDGKDNGINEMLTMTEFFSNYSKQPQLPMSGETSLQRVNRLYMGEATDDQKAAYIKQEIAEIDQEIEKLNFGLEWAEKNGYQLPDSYKKNIQYKLEDLAVQRKEAEYCQILTDTDPKELEKAIAAGKAFEGKYGEFGNEAMRTWDELFGQDKTTEFYHTLREKTAYKWDEGSEWTDDEGKTHRLDTITDDDENLYYYLLGKKVLELGDDFDKLWNNDSGVVDPKTEEVLTEIMKDGNDFIDFMTNDDYGIWTSRNMDRTQQSAENLVNSGFLGGAAANIASTLMTPIESVESALYLLDRALGDKRINPDTAWRRVSGFKESTRAATTKSIKDTFGEGTIGEKLASLGYEIYSNRGDSMMNSLVFGPLFGFSGKFGDMLNEFAGASPMGATAALNAAAHAVENGASTEQAWLIAGATFLSETITEAITYSNIKEAFGTTKELTQDSIKSFFKDWLTKNGVEEAFGESLNDIVENAAQVWAQDLYDNGTYKAELTALVDKYLAEGMTNDEATIAAIREQAQGVLHTALVSYLSAGADVFIKAGKSALNTTNNYRLATRAYQKIGYGDSMLDNMLNDWRRSRNGEQVATEQAVAEQAAEQATEQTTAQETVAEGEAPVVEAEEVTKKEAPTADQKEAATDVVNIERAKGSDASTQSAAMASALNTSTKRNKVDHKADAAAAYATRVFGENGATTIQETLAGAAEANLDIKAVKTALKNAALGDGAATALVQSEAFQKAKPADKARMLVQTLQQDSFDQKVQSTINSRVQDFRKTRTISDLAANGHFDQAQADRAVAEKAAQNTQRVEQELDTQREVQKATTDAVQQAKDTLLANPGDPQGVNAVTQAANKAEKQATVVHEYEQSAEKARQDQQAAEDKADKSASDAMSSARTIANDQMTQENQAEADKEQYRQKLMDDGVINRVYDDYVGEMDLFASKEELEARDKANFDYDESNGDILYFGKDENVIQALKDAGFHEIETYNGDTGESGTAYVTNSNNITTDQMKALNDFINETKEQARQAEDERTGKAQEDRENAAIEQAVANENLEGQEAEDRKDALREQTDKVKIKLRDLSKPVSNAEGMLALGALERKLGIKINLEDMGEVTKQGWTRGKYANGTITLNKNMNLGQALVEAALHEITHAMRNTNSYNAYRDVVMKSVFGETGEINALYENNAGFRAKVDATIAERIDAGDRNFVGKSHDEQVAAAEDEIVADFARLNLAEKDVVERFMDAGMGGKMRNLLHNINQLLKNYFSNMTGEERQQAEYFRKAERAFQKAINEVAKNSEHPEGSQFSIMQIAQATGMTFNEDTLQLFDQDGNEIDGVNRKITPDMIVNTPVGMLIDNGLTGEQNTKAKEMMAGLMNLVAKYKDSNLVWEIGATTLSSTFSALKSNSDPQYKTTVDFGTVCAKTQAIIDTLSQVMLDKVKEGDYGGLTRKDIMKVYDAVNKAGLSVPCPVCYVFSRWMGVPSLLGQMSQYQHNYVVTNEDGSINKEATQKNVDDYIAYAEKEYGDAKAINSQKTKLQNKQTSLEEKRIVLEKELRALPKGDKKARNAKQKEIDSVLDELTDVDAELGKVNAYNWITQALCKKDNNGKYVVDDKFQLTPDEILFDLNRTGDFAAYEKNWRYRNTRGAGMGKAIMPYSGETIGDILYGVKKGGRQSTIRNPWLNMDDKSAARQLNDARKRAAKQNLVGGQRLQSTSDFRPEWGLDYIMSFLELQAAGSKVQMYTKVAEAVDFFASVGADVNLSIMGKGQGWHIDENGNYVLDFSNVTGMDYDTAKALKDKYDNVQMILVGMNDTHIRLALANSDIDFVIPWHSSGNSKDVISGLMSTFKETLENGHNYEDSQSDTFAENRTEEQVALWDARMKLLTKGGNALTEAERMTLLSNPITADLYKRFTQKGVDDECYGVKLSKEQAKQIFPYEYWDTSLTKDQADQNGQRFVEYCNAMGIVPRFSQFKDDAGYWKLLIDRPMYNNDGTYHQQQIIDVTNAQIGDLNESGQLEGSDLPTQAQAKYAPKDPRNPNYEKYTEAQKQAIENAEAAIREQYDDGSEGQQSVYGEMSDADMELLRQTDEDYLAAVERGDMETAQADVDRAAEEAGYTDDVYHATNRFGFTEFDMRKGQGTIFVSYGKKLAQTYTRTNADVRGIADESQTVDLNRLSDDDLFEMADSYLKSIKDENGNKLKARVLYNWKDQSFVLRTNDGKFTSDWQSKPITRDELIKLLEPINNKLSKEGTYHLYAKPGNQLVVDADYQNWDEIPFTMPDGSLATFTTREVAEYAKENGYDSVRINNVVDDGGKSGYGDDGLGDIGIFFNQDDVKSADAVTYDDNGNVIPLSERFDMTNPDIRYSTGGEQTAADEAMQNGKSQEDIDIDTLVRSGALTQEEADAYHEYGQIGNYGEQIVTGRKLEGQNPAFSTAQGEAVRAFGDLDGMLMDSDEISNFAKAVVTAQNTYFPDTNADQIQRAINWIRTLKHTPKSDGFAEALQAVTADDFDYRSADGQARMVAVMGLAAAKNDAMAQAALADAFMRQGTDLGRALQARKLFKLMTPEGRIETLQRMLKNQTLEMGKQGKKVDLKFSDWIYQAAAVAENDADFFRVQQAAAAEIAQQLPANWKDRLTSFRMLSMLMNPRTHLRNMFGNALFVPFVGLKNKIGAVLELGKKEGERTKTISPFLDKDIREFARQDARANKGLLTGEAKFSEATQIKQNQAPLGEVMKWLSDINSKALEGEDWLFLRGHYRRALGGWMQANGYTVEQMKNNPALLEQGRQYAIQEAQKATYRDFNKIAQTLNEISRKGGFMGFMTDAVLPFKKTPANILRRGIEYSPVGIAKSIYNYATHMQEYMDYQNGKLKVLPDKAMSPTQVIDQLCSGLSGTAIMTLGFLLAGSGAVTCGLDDDEDKFEKAKGNQEYALRANLFGHDVTMTLDWAAPMSMPFFVGAALRNAWDDTGELNVDAVVNAFGGITEPVFNLSMLDGVNTLLKTNSYDKTNPIAQIGSKIATNYLSSFVPSFLGAVARVSDESRRKSFVPSDKSQGVVGNFLYAHENAQNKIPKYNYENIPMRNIWGEEVKSDWVKRVLENFILPGYVNVYNEDPVINEMARLYEVNPTENKNMIPDEDPDKSISYTKDKVTHKKVLTDKEWDMYKETRNKTAHKELTELINSSEYKNATDPVRVDMIDKVWKYADKVGKNKIIPDIKVDDKDVKAIAKDAQISGYEKDMITSLNSGDYKAYDTCVQALYNDGVDDSTIKTKIGNTYRDKYKEAYRKNDYATMLDIEEILENTGFDFDTEKWQDQVDENG